MDNKYLHITFEFIEIIVWHFTDDGVLEKFRFKHSILQEKTHWVSDPMSIWNAKHQKKLHLDHQGWNTCPSRRDKDILAHSAWTKASEGLSISSSWKNNWLNEVKEMLCIEQDITDAN